MPIFSIQPATAGLDEAMTDLLDELKVLTGDDPAYAKTAEQLVKLHTLKQNEKPDRVKLDTLLVVGGNIAIAVLILAFERENVVTTKLQSFLAKAR